MLAGRVLKLWTLWMKIRTLIIITKSFRYQMELLNLIRLFWGRFFFPYISRIHTAYTGEDSSIVGTNEMFGEVVGPKARLALKHQPPAIQAIPPKKFHLVPFASLSWSIFCPCDATRGVIGILRHDDHIFGKAGWKIPYPPRISSFTPSFLLVFIDAIWFGCITATVLVQLELVGQTTRI